VTAVDPNASYAPLTDPASPGLLRRRHATMRREVT
jgi:hypothetical protein